MKQRIFNVIIVSAIVILGISQYYYYSISNNSPDKVDVISLDQPEFLLSERPDEDLMKVLNYYDVKHPKIVYAQAVLETGHFRSKVCQEYNNLFGLYNSSTKDYYKFSHWSESVVAYINYIQYRYKPPNDYYEFLERIGYAEDVDYIKKVKSIVNSIESNDKI